MNIPPAMAHDLAEVRQRELMVAAERYRAHRRQQAGPRRNDVLRHGRRRPRAHNADKFARPPGWIARIRNRLAGRRRPRPRPGPTVAGGSARDRDVAAIATVPEPGEPC